MAQNKIKTVRASSIRNKFSHVYWQTYAVLSNVRLNAFRRHKHHLINEIENCQALLLSLSVQLSPVLTTTMKNDIQNRLDKSEAVIEFACRVMK